MPSVARMWRVSRWAAPDGTQASTTTTAVNSLGGDDLESLGYVFVYLARGSFPWQGLKAATDDEKDARIKEMKESLSAEALCDGFLPGEFATYINYTRGLAFEDKPDYLYLRRLFSRRFRAEGFTYDHIFDWTEKLFKEMQSEANPPMPSDTEVTETPKGKLSKKARRQRGRAASNPERSKRDLRHGGPGSRTVAGERR
ncbi:hypothetical protein VTK26DRAFT_8790 [Humicola hyalothermophila]